MRRRLAAGPLAGALIAVIAVLGGATATVLWRGTDAAALLQASVRQMTTPQSISPTPGVAEVPDIKSRALFYASRRFFVETAHSSEARLAPPVYVLEGTLLIPGRPAVAFLKHQPDGAPKAVHPGEALEGWKVGGVEPIGVILADGTRRIEITTKGVTSVASVHPPRMPVVEPYPARKEILTLGTGKVQKPTPISTTSDDARPKPAVRLYRPPN